MLNIYYDKKKFLLPQTWEELTAKQFIAVAKLLHSKNKNEVSLHERALKILSNKNFFQYFKLPADARLRCYKYCSWIFTNNLKVTTQLLATYKGLCGPATKFFNVQLEEFHYAEMAFYVFIHEKDDDALDELIAILWRKPKQNYDHKKNSDGDARIQFKVTEIKWNKSFVKKWRKDVKLAIVMWYASCRKWLADEYPLVFAGSAANENYYDGLYKTIRGLSGDKYGSFKDVEKLNLHLAMKEMQESIWEAKELKRKYPKLYE